MAIKSPIWLEDKYLNFLSYKLQLFKRVSQNTYKFRCPLCGDSQKNRLKTRGYVFEHEGHLQFKCHNCGESMGLPWFLERVDPELHKQYRLECIKESGEGRKEYVPDIGKFNKPRFAHHKQLKLLKKISQLSSNHGALAYVKNRGIPSKFHFKLFYCPKFMAWVNTIIPGKFEDRLLKFDEPRLIIPFVDSNGYMFGFQGRSFKAKSDLRYITIMLDENKPKIFGLDMVDFSKPIVYIVEGPIDSMFLPNCLAFAGADGNISDYVTKDQAVVIYDNEPRNVEICKKIFNAITSGHKVVIWPDYISAKDINDLASSGFDTAQILDVIDNSTYKGLEALARLNEWKRVSI